jgi:hypothetical protein
MNKIVSVDLIENAFDEVVRNIDKIENSMNTQIEIEINENKIAQLEKILFVDLHLSQLDEKTRSIPFKPSYHLAFGR